MRSTHVFGAALTVCVGLMASTALARENYALLIGANEYASLDPQYWLKGPSNDVKLVASYLTTAAPVPFAAQNVTVLADGIDGAPHATLGAIRGAFADLTAKVQPGDFVYLHFSGHGTQAPALNPDDELDGLDEMFLPVDIGPWSDTTGTVENALVDDEIGQMLDGLRAKGADVWVVFDACHSGTATRAAPSGDDEVRTRQLAPQALGVPTEALDAAQSRALPAPDPRAHADAPVASSGPGGSLVAFFAAQTDEVTPEKRLPKGKPDRVPQGVFTYALFETLAEFPQASYAQIGQEVLRKYAVNNLARSTPMFEGDLDRVVFSGQAGPRVAQWPAEVTDAGLTLAAGTLHGLREGGILAVMASAADATENALGYVQITALDTFTATATPIVQDGKTLPDDLPKGLSLRKISSDLDFTLTIALPETGSAPAAALEAAMEVLRAESGPRLVFVGAGQEADLRLAVLPDSPRPDAVWVLPATGIPGDLATTPSVSTADKDAETLGVTLSQMLGQMARAINLMKLGAAVGEGGLKVGVDLMTRNKQDKTLRALPVSEVPRLIPDDEVHIEASNDNDFPVDINVLYVGSDYSITHMFAGRMQPGDRLKKGLLRITDEAFGRDRIVMVMTPAKPQTAVENLGFLAQDALEITRSTGTMRGLTAALQEAGFGETTRAATALMDEEEAQGPAPMMLQFDLDTVPAN
ncbi:caspase family protein [Pseudorhodobacter sp. E13]|uniref:caspase family protein n=1 Tax=Pseudorhodobacter sp. E13 TaxID=2487931 RepID=UPI000F8D0287|nr:caspase family protein [Pseudorhodobacter sp. E13]RUS60727.1 caspase family protein [Pseudorhodobacter sp. E13]